MFTNIPPPLLSRMAYQLKPMLGVTTMAVTSALAYRRQSGGNQEMLVTNEVKGQVQEQGAGGFQTPGWKAGTTPEGSSKTSSRDTGEQMMIWK